MGVFEDSVTLPRPRADVFEYVRRSANLLKMFPDYSKQLASLNVPEVLSEGSQLEFEIKSMGSHFHFVHSIVEVKFHERLRLRQIQGPFRAWSQEHHFADTPVGDTILKTIVRFEPPGGMLGFIVTKKLIHSQLEKWVPHGHGLIKTDLLTSTSGL